MQGMYCYYFSNQKIAFSPPHCRKVNCYLRSRGQLSTSAICLVAVASSGESWLKCKCCCSCSQPPAAKIPYGTSRLVTSVPGLGWVFPPQLELPCSISWCFPCHSALQITSFSSVIKISSSTESSRLLFLSTLRSSAKTLLLAQCFWEAPCHGTLMCFQSSVSLRVRFPLSTFTHCPWVVLFCSFIWRSHSQFIPQFLLSKVSATCPPSTVTKKLFLLFLSLPASNKSENYSEKEGRKEERVEKCDKCVREEENEVARDYIGKTIGWEVKRNRGM